MKPSHDADREDRDIPGEQQRRSGQRGGALHGLRVDVAHRIGGDRGKAPRGAFDERRNDFDVGRVEQLTHEFWTGVGKGLLNRASLAQVTCSLRYFVVLGAKLKPTQATAKSSHACRL